RPLPVDDLLDGLDRGRLDLRVRGQGECLAEDGRGKGMGVADVATLTEAAISRLFFDQPHQATLDVARVSPIAAAPVGNARAQEGQQGQGRARDVLHLARVAAVALAGAGGDEVVQAPVAVRVLV